MPIIFKFIFLSHHDADAVLLFFLRTIPFIFIQACVYRYVCSGRHLCRFEIFCHAHTQRTAYLNKVSFLQLLRQRCCRQTRRKENPQRSTQKQFKTYVAGTAHAVDSILIISNSSFEIEFERISQFTV